MKKTRILLADDHEVVREGLKTLINAQPDMVVVGDAADGRRVIHMADTLKPDVVVLDISMPHLKGSEAARALKQAHPQLKILALTVHEDQSYVEELLTAGASGYVLKRAAANDLINALRVVVVGGTYLDPQVTGGLVQALARRQRLGAPAAKEVLTERETRVAQRIAQGYSNKEIAAQLELSVKTIETHKANCMEKLRLHSRAELVRYACEQGWLPGRT